MAMADPEDRVLLSCSVRVVGSMVVRPGRKYGGVGFDFEFAVLSTTAVSIF